MKLFAIINNYGLDRINSVKTWYGELTNSSIIKFASVAILVVFIGMFFYSETIKLNQEVEKLNNMIGALNTEIYERDSTIIIYESKQKVIRDFVKDVFSSNGFYTTTVTGYHPVEEQCDKTPDITADGTKIDVTKAGDYRYVALSRDLLTNFNKCGAKISFGDYIFIKGAGKYDGIYQVKDTMAERWKNRIDILLTPGQQPTSYKKVLMYKINRNEYITMLKEIYNEQMPLATVNSTIVESQISSMKSSTNVLNLARIY